MPKHRLFILLFFSVQNFIYGQNIPNCGFDRKFITPQLDSIYNRGIFAINNNSKAKRASLKDSTYEIKVIFHYIYPKGKKVDENLLKFRFKHLQEDFEKQNADTINLREIFRSRAGKSRIRLVLADSTPDGKICNGYTHKVNDKIFSIYPSTPFNEYHVMKFDSLGGVNAWDTKRYLNIWICDTKYYNPNNSSLNWRFAAYATPPPLAPNWPSTYYPTKAIDGIVYDLFWFEYFKDNRSSILTHEVGHYLGLRHVSGDPVLVGQTCEYDDGLFDTPQVIAQNYFTCDKAINTCQDSINDMPDMLENFMDYTGDDCRNSFTKQQVDLMEYFLTHLRQSLYKKNYNYSIVNTKSKNPHIVFFPNPSNDILHIHFEDSTYLKNQILIFDATGKQIFKGELNSIETIVNTNFLAPSCYTMAIKSKEGTVIFRSKLIIQ